MTELIRPMLYGAEHPVVALTSLGEPVGRGGGWGSPGSAASDATSLPPARVDGPVCESTDTLGRYALPALRRGDLVAIGETGAYAASMASAYNGRPPIAQVLLEPDGSLVLGRRRGGRAGPAADARSARPATS
jgi:diaminopimelate decarboxylase